jgi:EmrB/QacA subfamily drug resistance transporter
MPDTDSAPLVNRARRIPIEAAHPSAAGADSPAALRSPTGVALIIGTFLASMVTFLDANVVNVAVPAIGRHFGAGVTTLQWTLTSYLLTAAGFLLLAGALADRLGRRRVLEIGLSVLLVASLLCAIAPSVGFLIAARVAQGVGAALAVPTSLALLNGTLRVSDRARGIGIWAGISTLGTTVGPYAGGWLVDHASWRWVFLLNLPLIAGALLALRFVPELDDRRPLSVDVLGALLTIVGLSGVIYALSIGSASGWVDVRVFGPAAVGVIALLALAPVERRLRAPMLRLSLFASRQFDAINVTTILFYGALSAASYLLILQCELRLGYPAAKAGALLIPASAVFLVLSPISGIVVTRIGARWLMASGIACVGAAVLWLSGVRPGATYVDSILPPVLLWGLGLGLTVTPLTAAVLAAVSDNDLGEASAVNDAAARVGALVMIGVVPLLLGAGGGGLAPALADNYQRAMIAVALICGAAALVAGLFVTRERAPMSGFAPPAPHRGCALPVAPPTGSRRIAGRLLSQPNGRQPGARPSGPDH